MHARRDLLFIQSHMGVHTCNRGEENKTSSASSLSAIPMWLSKLTDERTTWSERMGELEGVLFPQQRGDKRMSSSSASGSSDSRGPLSWPSSIRLAVPSCGAYQLQQRTSTVSPRARKCLWLWRQFVFLNTRLCNMEKETCSPLLKL